ncbi:hypothetical protein D9M71_372840 [compost metagenome]
MQGEATLAGRGQLERLLRRRNVTLRNAGEIALGEAPDLVRGDVAHHHQGGIVRRVPGFVPVAQFLDLHAVEVGHPADGGDVVAAGRVSHRLETLERLGGGLVVGAQAALFLDHFDFAAELLGRQLEAGEAVGFQLEGHAQAVAGQHLVIGGVVVAGEGVLFGAELPQDARGFAGAELAAALEHHVFEGVGEAGLAGCLVARTDLVPELGDHHGRAVILADHDLQAVVQGELVGGLVVCSEGQSGQAESAKQQAGGLSGSGFHRCS